MDYLAIYFSNRKVTMETLNLVQICFNRVILLLTSLVNINNAQIGNSAGQHLPSVDLTSCSLCYVYYSTSATNFSNYSL